MALSLRSKLLFGLKRIQSVPVALYHENVTLIKLIKLKSLKMTYFIINYRFLITMKIPEMSVI